HFLQLRRHEEYGLSGVARLAELRVNELDRADVHPAGGLRGEKHAKRTREFAGNDDLLLIASRERARRQGRVRGPDVELGDAPSRVRRDLVPLEHTAARVLV